MSTRDEVRRAEEGLQRQMDESLRRVQRVPFNPNPAGGTGEDGDPRLRRSTPPSPPNMTPAA